MEEIEIESSCQSVTSNQYTLDLSPMAGFQVIHQSQVTFTLNRG